MSRAHINSILQTIKSPTTCDGNTDFLLSPLNDDFYTDNGLAPLRITASFIKGGGPIGDAVLIEEGTGNNGVLRYDFKVTENFTLSSYKKHVMDDRFYHIALTKNGNTFKLYYDGVETTEYQNKWVGYSVSGVNQNNKTWALASYTSPTSKFYRNEFILKNSFFSYSLAANNCGYFFKTYVYASAHATVWHRYLADNAGAMRVNNGNVQFLGGWINPEVNSSNPDVRIDLVPGWNLIEIWYMDYDTGGGLSLQRNSQGTNATGVDTGAAFVDSIPLSQVPQVMYMTAEIPIEFSSNEIYFNERSNCMISNVRIDNIARTKFEIDQWRMSASQFYFTNNNAGIT